MMLFTFYCMEGMFGLHAICIVKALVTQIPGLAIISTASLPLPCLQSMQSCTCMYVCIIVKTAYGSRNETLVR